MAASLIPVCFTQARRSVLVAAAIACHAASAAAAAGSAAVAASDEQFAIHGQFTYVEQETDGFNSPYAGPNSLTGDQGRETTDATLYLGARLWQGAELWLTPEIDQGFGLNDTLGLAAFSSAEAYKVGKNQPYLRLPHAFVRQTLDAREGVDAAQEREAVDPDLMQLGGSRSTDRWVLTVGKFAVTDVFDTNQYAHDQRNDFLNWAAIDAGSFDYAADAWGFTVGAAIEWYHGSWTLRAGVFDLSNVPNSEHLEPAAHEFQLDGEVEKRFAIGGRNARLLVTAFDTRGRMGLLDEAVQIAAADGGPVDIAAIRHFRSRLGASADLELTLSDEVGMFARLGKAAGNVESFEFSDIDRTVSGGLAIKGSSWHRSADTVGVAAIVDGISGARERYLNAGGLGILVGDGRLPHPGPEQVAEAYYRLAIFSAAQLRLDYQWARNPAYNTDRGPVSIVAVRIHAQF